jgi:methionyl-tRNA formyltransferase
MGRSCSGPAHKIIPCVKIYLMSIRIVFMGSPAFALPILNILARDYTVVGVVTQPDRPAGRGQVLTPPPIKELAVNLGVPVIQPNRLREPAAIQQLQDWMPDLIVVAAFGQILRQVVLDLPLLGCVNVHASLLPRWRGAAPVQAAILSGDSSTGITIMKMDAGVDTGAILSQRALLINANDNGESLSERLAELGAGLLAEVLPRYIAGKITPQPQDELLATGAVMIRKEDGLLDFTQPAEILERQVRAYYYWPGAYFMWQGAPFKVLRAHVYSETETFSGQEGIIQKYPAVGTNKGWLVLDVVQPAGKKPMAGNVFLRGAVNWGQIK